MKINLEDNISESLSEILKNYTFNLLKDKLQPEFNELIELYLNDKNSSTLRQYLTANVCGYKNSFKKLGYDAIDEQGNHKEIKPTNKHLGCKKRYNGKFGVSDYTIERYNKDIIANVHVLQSFFVDGRLMYIIEFPLIDIDKRMKFLIDKHLTKKSQKFIRSAEFSFKDLKQENIIIKYVSNNIDLCKPILSEKLFKFIKSQAPIIQK